MDNKISEDLQRQLRALELLDDESIDTSDIPEQIDWSEAISGLWNPIEYQSLGIDIRAVANEILSRLWQKNVRPTNMALNKLTWFVFEEALVTLKLLISPARAEAWDHGPVFREIYSPSKKYGKEPIEELLSAFSREERCMVPARAEIDEPLSNLIDQILQRFGGLSSSQLREISHRSDGPWEKVWKSGRRTSAGMVISPHLIVAAADAGANRDER